MSKEDEGKLRLHIFNVCLATVGKSPGDLESATNALIAFVRALARTKSE
jgi:hypothetical protein